MAVTVKGDKATNLILRATPSGNGLLTLNVEQSWRNLQAPLNTTMAPSKVVGKPVDMARNELVEIAKLNNACYLLFIDDDILPPFDGLSRLWYQLENTEHKVASGVYYSKTQPSTPVILKSDRPGGFTDWKHGEIIDVDYAGCGFMLIKMDLFDKWPDGVPYFKFNRGRVDLTPDVGFLGEDVWFCKQVTDMGYKIIVDTSVQCGHEDHASGFVYQYDKRFNTGVWFKPESGKVMYLPKYEQAEEARAKEDPKVGGMVAWTGKNEEGYFQSKVTTPDEIRKSHSLVDDAVVKNLFEFRSNEQTHGIIKAIYDVMSDKGAIEIHVPDAGVRCSLTDESTIEDIEKIVGNVGGKFMGLYTERFMEDTMKSAGFKRVTILKSDDDMLIVKGIK